MKNLIFYTLCLVIFGSCLSGMINGLPRQYYGDNQKLIEIETTGQNLDIVVHHLNEAVGRSHLKVAILEAVGDANASYANLILEVKQKARQENVDAIAIFKQSVSQRDGTDIEGYAITVNVKEVVAYGIIYKENLDIVNRFPKIETVYGYNSKKEEYETYAVKKLDLNQSVINVKGDDKLSKVVQPYSMKHLLRDTENWTFHEKYNKVQFRVYRNQTGLTKKCQFEYDSIGRVKNIEIDIYQENLQNNQYIYQLVNLNYDEFGRLFRKKIYPYISKKEIYYEEIFVYEENQLKEKILYTMNNETRTPIGKFIYTDYYTMEDLETIYPELK